MSVMLPQLYGSNTRLHPTSLTLQLNARLISTAKMILPPGERAKLHQLFELYTQNGSAGVYRAISVSTIANGAQTANLAHGIDLLSDAVIPEQSDFTGTVQALLEKVMANQTTKVGGVNAWRLGTCECTEEISVKINYTSLYDILETVEEEKSAYVFAFDQSSLPWTLSLVRRPSTVSSEFRLSRNVTACTVTDNDSDLCTRLHLSMSIETEETVDGQAAGKSTETVVRTYDDTAAQAVYGVVQRTEGVTVKSEAEGAAFAARYLREHNHPLLQIQISGAELNRITGEAWDEIKLGELCRVALPDEDTWYEERVETISYPDALNTPEQVTVSLASTITTASAGFAAQAKQISSVGRIAGGGAGAAGNALIAQRKTDFMLYEAGIVYDADHVMLFAKNEGLIGRRLGMIDVRADAIELSVTDLDTELSGRIDETDQNISLAVGRIRTAEGKISTIEGSALWTQRDSITAATGQMHVVEYTDDDGNKKTRLVVDSGGGLYINRNGSQLGVWDSGNLTAGIIVERLNDQKDTEEKTYVRLKADAVDLGAYATVKRLEALEGEFNKLIVGDLVASKIKTNAIVADQIFSNSYISELTPEGQDNPYNLHLELHAISIDDEVKARFIGTADVNFDRAAAVREGVSSVTVSNSDIVLDGDPDYLATTNKYRVYVEATASNGAYGTAALDIDATEAYRAGAGSVSQRSAQGLAAYGSPSYADSTCTQQVTVTYTDSTTTRLYLDATAAYSLGYTAGKIDGWDAAIEFVNIPTSGRGASFTVFFPSRENRWQGGSRTYTLSEDGSYAYVKTGGVQVAVIQER